LGGLGEPALSDALAQVVEQFLGALQSEGRDDDVPAAFERLGYGLIELIHGWSQFLVQPVPVCRFNHDIFGVRRSCGAAQQNATSIAQIT